MTQMAQIFTDRNLTCLMGLTGLTFYPRMDFVKPNT